MVEIIKALNNRQVLIKENEKFFVISESNESVPREVLIFESDDKGEILTFHEVNGEVGVGLGEFLGRTIEKGVYSRPWDDENMVPY